MGGDSQGASLHKQTYESVSAVGHKIGRDLVEKIVLALSNARIIGVDVDRVLHIFVIISMLVEATTSLGLNKQELASARTQVKAVLLQYMQIAFQSPKAKEILYFMGEENWRVADVSAMSLNVVQPLSPDFYKKSIKTVKNYLSGAASETFVENPFYAPHMLEPQDTSAMVKTGLFSAYWASVKDSMTDIGTQEGNALPGMGASEAQRRRSSIDASLTLAERAPLPPTTVTSSALSVTNAFLEYEARIAVRFPPLAADILEWCEELVSLYIFTVADNFVSVSKSVPIENQGDFSLRAQATLKNMRNLSLKVLNASNGYYTPSRKLDLYGGSSANSTVKFPPKIWMTIKDDFSNEGKQYALGNRAVACDSCITLVYIYEAMVQTIAPLLPSSVCNHYLDRCKEIYSTAVEMLNVCIHRLCLALNPMKSVIHDIGKMKSKKDEVTVSAYVSQIVPLMDSLNARRPTMPTPVLETLFLQRFVFSVQFVLVQEYSKLAKKKLSDVAIMQLQVDAQTFQQQASAAFGRQNIVKPDHVLGLIKTGFYMEDKQQIVSWLRAHHTNYNLLDLVSWFSGSDKVFKLQLEDILVKELKHTDAIPIENFVQSYF
ncbi:hypothetical protein AGDE_11237 [Angomonas deanei]|uniref:Syndetin C-terminal domain-containing protein n=1 Tax=Angomonas deanei TaxID=59799 RepID=A0A7G2CIX2_9TRYP|nr:hypothetical protein AGDE_11237 [Angomonas deanei]CAD2219726.1 Protein of unknown function C-terminus (DUF2451), putative [Angomonas deanei]|eukprot:EPY26524.1 hypothetical protein AGDE_11237 [Angomonas deanei]